jgi:perosamine synthetase
MGNLKKIYHSKPTITKKDIKNVLEVLKSEHLEDGEEVIKLENKMKRYFHKKYAVAVNNGFAAIHLSLIALNIKKNDEVIIPSYSCPALLNPILIQKATPIIIDTQKHGFNLSYKELKNKITKNTKVIILPYMFGFPTNIDKIMKLGIPVIEDCTMSLGGKYKGKLLGTFSDTMICSFYATKMITSGDGAILLTNNKEVYESAKNHRYYGHQKQHKYLAYNYHTTNLPMKLALSQFEQLDKFIKKRKKIAAKYDECLKDIKEININFKNKKESIYYRYLIEIKDRDNLKEYLRKNNIDTGFGVLEGLHELVESNGKYINTTKLLNNILSLPIYPTLKIDDVEKICQLIKNYYKGEI